MIIPLVRGTVDSHKTPKIDANNKTVNSVLGSIINNRKTIPLKEYNRNLYSNKSRDHLYGNGQLPLDKWIFTHKDTGSQFNIQKMLDGNIPLCHDKIVYKFLHLSEKIIDLLYGVKMDFKE